MKSVTSKRGRLLEPRSVAAVVETPALVVDERVVGRVLEVAARVREESGCRILYTLKPLAFDFVLEQMAPVLDGFAASSLFEARLARSAAGPEGSVHVTTPGFRPADVREIGELCNYVGFNSLSQLRRFAAELPAETHVGLRVNPGLPLLDDDRYNPCRPQSKLGAPIRNIQAAVRRSPALFDRVSGIQFHTNCDCESFEPLFRTVRHLVDQLGPLLERLKWINLGGGYLLQETQDAAPLAEAVNLLQSQFGLEVFFEPGAAFVREAGYLVAEVIDLFRSGKRTVAVLDTTVNHFPEAFEYQFEPDILDHNDEADHEYMVVGSTCLAGDALGLYGFEAPLKLGSRLVLPNLGAYAMVKAHMFNGINLPSVYSVTSDGQLVLRRRFTYDDFLTRWETNGDAAV